MRELTGKPDYPSRAKLVVRVGPAQVDEKQQESRQMRRFLEVNWVFRW